MSENLPGWLTFLGRWHPVLVHLPIGFLTLLAVIELLGRCRRFAEANGAKPLLLLLTSASVVVSAACGWLLAWGDAHAGNILFWHQWLGTALVPVAVALSFFHVRGARRSYRASLIVAMVLLTVTGHYGAVLVHGPDYLFPASGASGTKTPTSDPATAGSHSSEPTVYATAIQPIFDEYCVACHGPDKAKGRLRLDTAAALFHGGDSGPAVQAGNLAKSLLLHRVRLPLDEDEHMPPAGKKQPDERHLAWLEWWVNVGAPTNKPLTELRPPETR